MFLQLRWNQERNLNALFLNLKKGLMLIKQ